MFRVKGKDFKLFLSDMGIRQHRPHATLISIRYTKEGNNVCIYHQFLLIDSAGYVNQLNRKVPFSTFDEISFHNIWEWLLSWMIVAALKGKEKDERTQPYIQLSSLDQALFWVGEITRSRETQPHNRETISHPDLKYPWYQRFCSQVRLDASVSAGGRPIFGRIPKSRAAENRAWKSLAPRVDLQL